MTTYLGHLAALGTSVSWSFTSTFFTLSGRQVGSPIVNRTRLLLGLIFVTLVHWATQGQPFPFDAKPFRLGWLALSGIIGFVIGDALLFQAFVLIGPRLSMLLMALAPVFSVALGWMFFGEALNTRELGGVALVVGGVALVVLERRNGEIGQADSRRYGAGILFGLGGALGQAGGLVASKLGLAGDFSALSGNLIRLVTATLVMWLLALLRREIGDNFNKLRAHPRALAAIVGGSVAGPFIGVWLSLIAIQLAPLGIAATLMSLPPIILLPIGKLLFNEHIGLRAIVGTVVAFVGTAILFL